MYQLFVFTINYLPIVSFFVWAVATDLSLLFEISIPRTLSTFHTNKPLIPQNFIFCIQLFNHQYCAITTMEETIDRIPKLKKNITELRPEIVDKMEEETNLSILDTFLVTYIQEPLLLLNQSMSYVLLIKVRTTIHSAIGNVFATK